MFDTMTRDQLMTRAERLIAHGFESDDARDGFDAILREVERRDRSTPAAPSRPGPTAAQLDAVDRAFDKVLARGTYRYLDGHVLPDSFRGVTWDDPLLYREHKAGCTATFPDGRVCIALRSDLSPADVHRVCLHELMHVCDAGLPMPLARREWRARALAERLKGL
jgi:hypothetical protein